MQKLHRHVPSRRSTISVGVAGPSQLTPARADQVQNHAGGFVFGLNPFDVLARFLTLGTEGGTYYASERKLTKDACKSLDACLRADHGQTVDMIRAHAHKVPKMDTVLFAYARACSTGTDAERHYALGFLPEICKIGTHLFTFMEYSKAFRGGGKGLRKALSRWYTDKTPREVAFQVTKYAQRNGWAHSDVLRLAHPVAKDEDLNFAFKYALGKKHKESLKFRAPSRLLKTADTAQDYLSVVEAVKGTDQVSKLVDFVKQYRLPREVLPTQALKSPKVWQALLDADMPTTALIRNLGNLSSVGLLIEGDREVVQLVCNKLTDPEILRKSHIHPMNMLVALRQYRTGHGDKGSKTWTPVRDVNAALEEGFYKSFGFVKPTGKRIMNALDVSGSMSCPLAGFGISAMEAATVMCMVNARVEENPEFFGFDQGMRKLPILKTDSLEQAYKKAYIGNGGGTDCSLPALMSLKNRWNYDAFVIYTDNETWAGRVHPYKALAEYRRFINPEARQVVVGMVTSGFTIADPQDQLSLDVVGFGLDTPQAISWFIRGGN